MAVFGGLLFRRVPLRRRRAAGRNRRPRFTVARFAATRPVALLIAAACTVGLLAAASAMRDLRLGSPLIRELPASATAVRAGTAASDGFAPGILSPTEILVIGPGVTGQTAALARLQAELAAQPGVAELAGPASVPDTSSLGEAIASLNPMLASSGGAARFVLVDRTDPLDATAISEIIDELDPAPGELVPAGS